MMTPALANSCHGNSPYFSSMEHNVYVLTGASFLLIPLIKSSRSCIVVVFTIADIDQDILWYGEGQAWWSEQPIRLKVRVRWYQRQHLLHHSAVTSSQHVLHKAAAVMWGGRVVIVNNLSATLCDAGACALSLALNIWFPCPRDGTSYIGLLRGLAVISTFGTSGARCR